MKTFISTLFLLLTITCYSQNRLNFSLSLNGTKTSFTGPDGAYNTFYGPACKCNDNYYKPTLGLTAGMDYRINNGDNIHINTGLYYNLTGTRVKVTHDIFNIKETVYAHYLQVPLSFRVNILDPFHFYAGLSYNFAFWFTKGYKAVYSPYLLRSDFRAHAGLGWSFGRFSVFAQFEESLFHFAKTSYEPTPGDKIPLLEPTNANVSLGIKIPVNQIFKN